MGHASISLERNPQNCNSGHVLRNCVCMQMCTKQASMIIDVQKLGREQLFLEIVGRIWRDKTISLIGVGIHQDLQKLAGGISCCISRITCAQGIHTPSQERSVVLCLSKIIHAQIRDLQV